MVKYFAVSPSASSSVALPSVRNNSWDVHRGSAAEEAVVGTDQGLYNAGLFEGDIQLQPTVGVINEIPI